MATQILTDELQIMVVSDGDVDYPSTCFAPGQDLHTPFLVMHHNILTLKWKDRVILFDTGNGYAYRPGAGRLPDRLGEKGITPEMVTDVILTHAHPDHINGLVDAQGQVVFPNAQIHLSKVEFGFWTEPNPDFSKSKNTPEACMELYQGIRSVLLKVIMTRIFPPFLF
jgi:glyoxylase-like metal-dependent hydrolase (beta-lactamase superfamily II)